MDPTSAEISLIISNLTTIKIYLFCVLVLIGIVAFTNLARGIYYMRNEIKKAKSETFADVAKELIEKNELEAVKRMSRELLTTHPSHSYATYYLARVYYIENQYDKCRELLNKLLKTEPAWRDNFIKPMLNQLNEQQNGQ